MEVKSKPYVVNILNIILCLSSKARLLERKVKTKNNTSTNLQRRLVKSGINLSIVHFSCMLLFFGNFTPNIFFILVGIKTTYVTRQSSEKLVTPTKSQLGRNSTKTVEQNISVLFLGFLLTEIIRNYTRI